MFGHVYKNLAAMTKTTNIQPRTPPPPSLRANCVPAHLHLAATIVKGHGKRSRVRDVIRRTCVSVMPHWFAELHGAKRSSVKKVVGRGESRGEVHEE